MTQKYFAIHTSVWSGLKPTLRDAADWYRSHTTSPKLTDTERANISKALETPAESRPRGLDGVVVSLNYGGLYAVTEE